MSGTVMKFGPQWIRTLTDGAVPSSASAVNSNTATTSTTTIAPTSQSSNLSANSTNNNTNNSCISNSGGGKYKLAEYRYGREEMLALYESGLEAPGELKRFSDIYIEKARQPIAMTQMSEEEIKLSTKNWNSEAVLRSVNKIPAACATGIPGSNAILGGGSGSNLPGGIGTVLNDRDRQTVSMAGRLPPGEFRRLPPDSKAPFGMMKPKDPLRGSVGRGPMYMRSQSHEDEALEEAGNGFYDTTLGTSGQMRQPNSLRARFAANRPTVGLNGSKPIDIKAGGQIDGELSTSAGERRAMFDRASMYKYNAEDKTGRKDVNGRPATNNDWRLRDWSGSGIDNRASKLSTEDRSWRSTRTSGAGSSEDWRSNAVGNSSSSWYVRSNDPRARTGPTGNQDGGLSSSFSGKRDNLRRTSGEERQGEEDDEAPPPQPRPRRDSLPEWSIGDPLSGDKVGSFDATGAFREVAREDGGEILVKNKNRLKTQDDGFEHLARAAEMMVAQWSAEEDHEPSEANSNYRNKVDLVRDQSQQHRHGHEIQSTLAHISVESTGKNQNHQHQSTCHDQTSVKSAPFEFNSLKDIDSTSVTYNKPITENTHDPVAFEFDSRKDSSNDAYNKTIRESTDDSHNKEIDRLKTQDDRFANLDRNVEIMLAEWTSEEDQDSRDPSNFAKKMTSNRGPNHHPDPQVANARPQNHSHPQQTTQQAGSVLNPASIADQAAFNSSNQKKFILLPFNHEDSQQWYYRDTQSVIQGPFSATEMFEWYKAGYFVKELPVRRACDELFYSLGEVIKLWDRIPFAPINGPPPPPMTGQALIQMRAVAGQLEMAAQGQIPTNNFGITHPGAVLLHGPLLQAQQQQVYAAAASFNQNRDQPQPGIRQILEATRQHDPAMVQQRAMPANVLDQNEMQAQLRQLLAQLKSREEFSSLNSQQQQEVLVRQFVASRAHPGTIQDQDPQQVVHRTGMMPILTLLPTAADQDRYMQQRMELERRQREEAETQNRLMMEQRLNAEEEKQRIMDELQKRQRKQAEESDKQRLEAEKERIIKMGQLKQQQLAKQQEEFREQMKNQQRLQQQQQQQQQPQQAKLKQHQQVTPLSTIQQQQQQQVERAKKAAAAHQVQQEQQRKTAWSTVTKTDQEPVSLATLQKMQEEEKEREREKQRQLQQLRSSQQQQQQQQQQLQKQMTWANAAQQSKVAPVKTLAEIQKEEEERLAREKQKKSKVQPTVPNAGVWNNAASHLNWKNPLSDS